MKVIESTTQKRYAPELLERELWLLAMCWRTGMPLSWKVVDCWLDALLSESTIAARA